MSDERLARITIGPGATIREAMQAINEGAVEIALQVVDGVLRGTVSDGDIRRALLAGASLDDRVDDFVTTSFVSVPSTLDRVGSLDLMHARSISQLPVVDEQGRLLGMHVLRDLLGKPAQDISAVILAGGLGSRLRPYTETVPKPMLPVAGRPLLERLVLQLVAEGISDITLAVNYRGELIEEHFGDGERFGCRISYVREKSDQPLGTAGCLAQVSTSRRPVLAINGDLLLQFSVAALAATHDGAWATVGARPYSHPVPFGVLQVDAGRLTGIREKPIESWAVNAGVYLLSPDALAQVPTDTRMDMPELLSLGLERGEVVRVHDLEGEWLDVGRPEDLGRARGAL